MKKKSPKTIYVIDSIYNGLTAAFTTKEDALKEVISAWIQEWSTMYKDYYVNDKKITAVQQIAEDLKWLMDYDCILDYASIIPMQLVED